MPILPDLKCFHKNWRPHGPESVDLGEPTNHARRSGKNKVRLEASCLRHEKAARDDPDTIGMDLDEESAFDRSEEHKYELPSLMHISKAAFGVMKTNNMEENRT